MVFAGPVRPGTSEQVFRETGREQRLVRGPLPRGTTPEQERAFREGRGISIPQRDQARSLEQQRSRGRQIVSKATLFINRDVNKLSSDLRNNFVSLIRGIKDRN